MRLTITLLFLSFSFLTMAQSISAASTQLPRNITIPVLTTSYRLCLMPAVNAPAQPLQIDENVIKAKQSGLWLRAPYIGGFRCLTLRCGRSITPVNDPLIVIDGVPVKKQSLSSLNPDDIESISILKNAVALAIYGYRAMNGVVIIVMKKKPARQPVVMENKIVPATLNVFPNPVIKGSQLNIDLRSQAAATSIVRVIDMGGRILISLPAQAVKNSSIALAIPQQWQPGVYIIQAIAVDGSIARTGQLIVH